MAVVVPDIPKYFTNKVKEPLSMEAWLKVQQERLKDHVEKGGPLQSGCWPPPVLPTENPVREWGYIGIISLLQFYNQYKWPDSLFEWKDEKILNLAGFIKHHIEVMHKHKGTIEYLPSLAVLIKLKVELSKKKNLPKNKRYDKRT